jgi:hypothetical protein
MICEKCNNNAHTSRVIFRQNIGLIFLHLTKEFEGNYCKNCIRQIFIATTLKNLFLGWWSLKSLIFTPTFIFLNTIEFFKVRKTPKVPSTDSEKLEFVKKNILMMEPYTDDVLRSLSNKNSIEQVTIELSDKACVPRKDAHAFVLALVNRVKQNTVKSQF